MPTDKLRPVTDVADVVIIGGGAMGTSAARALAKRGRDVLVLERFEVGHAHGSSGGPTRIFRLSYHHPDYVRLARHAIASWRDLEDEAGEPLLIPTGGVDVGDPDGLRATALAAAGEPFELISSAAASERWPAIRFPAGVDVLVQDDAAVCMAERTMRALHRAAAAAGATILERTPVEAIARAGAGRRGGPHRGSHKSGEDVVVAAGAWAGSLLHQVGIDLPLRTTLEQGDLLRLRSGRRHRRRDGRAADARRLDPPPDRVYGDPPGPAASRSRSTSPAGSSTPTLARTRPTPSRSGR